MGKEDDEEQSGKTASSRKSSTNNAHQSASPNEPRQKPDSSEPLVEQAHRFKLKLERRNLELLRSHSEIANVREHFRRLHESAPTGIATLSVTGIVEDINAVGADMLGWDRKSVIGKPFVSLMTREAAQLFVVYQSAAMRTDLAQTCTVQFRRPDRQVLDAQLRLLTIPDLQANIKHLRLTMTDLSGTERSETPIDFHEFAQGLLDILSQPVVILDDQARVLMASASFCTHFAIEAEASIGQSLWEVCGAAWDFEEMRGAIERAMASPPEMVVVETTRVFPQIGDRALRMRATKVSDHSTFILVLAVEDVTDTRRMEHELETLRTGRTDQ